MQEQPQSLRQLPDRPASLIPAGVVCLGLAALVWFSFGQGRNYPFVNFDDPEYVYEVPEINHGLTTHGLAWAFTHVPSPNWYPLTNISHMIEAQCFGTNAGAYHVTNVVLHAATVIVLFLVMLQMTATFWPSAFVAAVFAIHPLRTESVMWITERKDVLSGLFFVLALGAYVRYSRKRSAGRYLLVALLFACGLMSKPMVVTLPLVLLLLDYWPLRRAATSETRDQKLQTWLKLFAEKIPLFALSIASAIITSLGGMHFRVAAEQLSLASRIGNAFVSYVVYIGQMIWPVKLAVFYPYQANQSAPAKMVLAIAILAAITLATVLVRKSRPYLLVGWFWFVVMMLPVVGFVQVNLQAHADRYTYLPQIGLYVAIAWAIAEVSLGWIGRLQMLGSAAAVVIALLAWTARTQATSWKDSEALWRHAISVTSSNSFAHASLADLLLRRGRIDEAIANSREALRIEPANADAENNLGLALLQKAEPREATIHFERCLQINPDHMNGQANLAWILATSPDPSTRDGARAVQLVENLVSRSGHPNAIVLRTLAAAYAANGQFAQALETAQQALEIARAAGDKGLTADLEANIANYGLGRPLQ